VLAITAIGEVRASNLKLRSGARPGDVIAVTGPLGASRAGLLLAVERTDLAADPRVVVHLESGDDVVIIEGVVEDLVTDADVATRIGEKWTTKYGQLLPEPATGGICRLRPYTARAWSNPTFGDATHWRFTDIQTENDYRR